MTIITVRAAEGRISAQQRARLAESLTDAVLVPEIGQFVAAARAGFQVHFPELAADCMAIGGKLVSESGADVITIDVAVMDGDWPPTVRKDVISNILAALVSALDANAPSTSWWVTFRIIDEGSWGARGDVLSILDLLETGMFTPEKAQAICARIGRYAG